MGVRLVPRRYSNEWQPPSLGRKAQDDESDDSKLDEATRRVLNRDMAIFVFSMTITISLLVLSKMQHSPYQYASAALRALTHATPMAIYSSASKMTDLAEFVSSCHPLTPQEQSDLQSQITTSEHSATFHLQIAEARGAIPQEAEHVGILTYLTNHVLRPQWSILELGCGAGTLISELQKFYERTSPAPGGFDPLLQSQVFVGVELVGGWVNEMANELKGRGIDMYQGDITEFTLPEPYREATFDFIMLNDVVEHIQPTRYGCLFTKLREVSHPGTLVYLHTPTPQAQLVDSDQYYENVIPYHVLAAGMAMAGFEVVDMQSDKHTSCGGNVYNLNRLPRSFDESACNHGGHAKYSHMIFQRVYDDKVLELN